MSSTLYKYHLDKSSKKFACPQCRHKSFVRYKDDNNNYLPEHVGRCDREHKCAHHYPPKQYFADNAPPAAPAISNNIAVEERIDYVPQALWQCSLQGYGQSNFMQYLITLFGKPLAMGVAAQYKVARSMQDGGKAVIFWQSDIQGNIRSGKIVAYNPQTGKRIKDEAEALATGTGLRDSKGSFTACLSVNPLVKKATGNKALNLVQCFFGEHLLSVHPHKPVGIVESEKTAIICAILMPNMVWLATGGANGCKWREYAVYKALAGRDVTLYPDHGYYNRAKNITCYDEWMQRAQHIRQRIAGHFAVSAEVEGRLRNELREDRDLADILLITDEVRGGALNGDGYPFLWDVNYDDYGVVDEELEYWKRWQAEGGVINL